MRKYTKSLILFVVAMIASVMLVSVSTSSASASGRSWLYKACHATPIIVHRGDTGPTLRRGPDEDGTQAMLRAFQYGANGSESDTRKNASGIFWMLHNSTLDHITHRSGTIASKSAVYMESSRTTMKDGHHLSSLAGYLHTFMTWNNGYLPKHHKHLEIELKPQRFTASDAQYITTVQKRQNALGYVHWSSFVQSELTTLHTAMQVDAPTAQYQLLAAAGHTIALSTTPSWVKVVEVTYLPALRAYRTYGTYIAAAHAQGKLVYVWTINSSSEWANLLKHHVDGILTDNVAAYRSWCARR